MAKTLPIKNRDDIENIKKVLLDNLSWRDYRNFTLFTFGINTALRISDILELKWGDVYNFKMDVFYEHVDLVEKKTGKRNCVFLNSLIIESLILYMNQLKVSKRICNANIYLFPSQKGNNNPITRVRAYEIIKGAATKLGMKNISCHSMRKTFGYHAWKAGASQVLLMSIFNHSNFETTRIYLGIAQEDKDEIYRKVNL